MVPKDIGYLSSHTKNHLHAALKPSKLSENCKNSGSGFILDVAMHCLLLEKHYLHQAFLAFAKVRGQNHCIPIMVIVIEILIST
jgi:hypothetical protein